MSLLSSIKARFATGAVDVDTKWWWIGGVAVTSVVGMALVALGAKRPPVMVSEFTGDDIDDSDDHRLWTKVKAPRLPHLEENTGAGVYDNQDVTAYGSTASWPRDGGARFFSDADRRRQSMAEARRFGRAKTK